MKPNDLNPNDLKLVVQEKYGLIATQSNEQNQASCCGSGGCANEMDYTVFSDDYSGLDGYMPGADLGLGCGLPTEFAGIKEGDHVLDLGSGAGNDCFVARRLTGARGHVTGLDFTPGMIRKARENLSKTGFTNIRFIQGDIENIPLPDGIFDVVISNCVLNLVPDKQRVYQEIYRVLKPGGRLCISDVVVKGQLPDELRDAAEMYAGCVSGAIEKQQYLDIVKSHGFSGINIQKEKQIYLPENILMNHLDPIRIKDYKSALFGITSITLVAVKPGV